MAPLPDYPDPAVVRRLARPEAYPHDPDAAAPDTRVEAIQTHLSHVFLTPRRVYKWRKPVRLPFVDFGERGERNADCLREVAVNRRLAPDVYLGVAPLETSPEGGVRVGPPRDRLATAEGRSPEHCVVMRRLPEGRDALTLLGRGLLRREHLERLAARMAAFHADHGLGVPAPFSREAWLEHCAAPVEASFRSVAEGDVDVGDALSRAREQARSFLREHADRFEDRRLAGRAVDAHGDLHLQHVWFESDDAQPLVIDGLEFDEDLRHIDVAAEVAFTAMDLRYRGEPALAEHFLRHYARASGDFDLYGVVDFFVAYRAAVRAKVAAIAAADTGMDPEQRRHAAESTRRHVELAERALLPRAPGALVLVGGIVGTGKSTVAEALARALEARPGVVVISSDRERKRRAGLAPQARTDAGADEGLYAPGRVHETYEGVRDHARRVCRSGRVAVLDATWSSRKEREQAFAVAKELGVGSFFVESRCAPDETRERLRRRAEAGRDPSDAGPERYDLIAGRYEPFADGEPAELRPIHTDAPDWRARAEEVAREIAGDAPPETQR